MTELSVFLVIKKLVYDRKKQAKTKCETLKQYPRQEK